MEKYLNDLLKATPLERSIKKSGAMKEITPASEDNRNQNFVLQLNR